MNDLARLFAVALIGLGLWAMLTPESRAAAPIRMHWEHADYGKPAPGYVTCYYTQLLVSDPLRVSVVVTGLCPMSIRYDPVTGTWSR